MFSLVSSLHTSKQTWCKNESSVGMALLVASNLFNTISLWALNEISHVAHKDVHVCCFVHENCGIFDEFSNNPN